MAASKNKKESTAKTTKATSSNVNNNSNNNNNNNTLFAQHAQDDAALADTNNDSASNNNNNNGPGLTILGRIIIFLGFPTMVGIVGLYMGYLAHRKDPENRQLKFDSDFAMPFVLALSMAIVIGFQTRGYRTSKVEPLVHWPKVRKRRKIIHKHVVAGEQEEEEVEKEDDKKQN